MATVRGLARIILAQPSGKLSRGAFFLVGDGLSTAFLGHPRPQQAARPTVVSRPFQLVTRTAVRALVCPLPPAFDAAQIQVEEAKLARVAASQALRVLQPCLLTLHGDPLSDPEDALRWELALAVSGPAVADESAGVTVSRLHGGSYLATMTPLGLAGRASVYKYFLGSLLPQRKQQLTRPTIYHRLVQGLPDAEGAPASQTLQVFFPIQLSLATAISPVEAGATS